MVSYRYYLNCIHLTHLLYERCVLKSIVTWIFALELQLENLIWVIFLSDNNNNNNNDMCYL